MWTGGKNKDGYGRLEFQTYKWYAHRLSYTLLVGIIPEGLQLDHLCRVPLCVNPDHLEPVTLQVNQARKKGKWAKPKTKPKSIRAERKERGECHRGHRLATVGVLESRKPNGAIRKQCRACQHDVQERYRRKHGIPERGRYFDLLST